MAFIVDGDILTGNSTLIDMHVHSNCSDGTHNPASLARHAKRRGLGGIAIVDHAPKLWDSRVIAKRFRLYRDASAHAGFLILPGVEFSLSEGHVLAIFPSYDFSLHFGVEAWDLPALSDHVRSAGGILVAAHVFRRSGLGLNSLKYAEYLDALEYYPPPQVDFLRKLNLPRIAGSDSHTALTLGFAATAFEGEVSSLVDALELIRSGHVHPVCRLPYYLRKILDLTRLLNVRFLVRMLTS